MREVLPGGGEPAPGVVSRAHQAASGRPAAAVPQHIQCIRKYIGTQSQHMSNRRSDVHTVRRIWICSVLRLRPRMRSCHTSRADLSPRCATWGSQHCSDGNPHTNQHSSRLSSIHAGDVDQAANQNTSSYNSPIIRFLLTVLRMVFIRLGYETAIDVRMRPVSRTSCVCRQQVTGVRNMERTKH